MTLIQLIEDTVIGGSVRMAGEVFDVDSLTATQLERKLIADILDDEPGLEMEKVYPEATADGGRQTAIRDVLVFIPVYRLEPETVDAVLKLEWDGAISHLFQRDNPHPPHRDKLKQKVFNHLHQYQRGREVFLRGRYDAMLIIESDIIPPADALKKLAAVPTDVAYGVYRFRGDSDIINIFERYADNSGRRARNVGESLSVRPLAFRHAIKAGVYPCSGAGFGVVLIRRHVLEKVDFRAEYPTNGAYCDTWFTEDVYRAGYSMAAEMSVICGHKDVDGKILWPKMPRAFTTENAEHTEKK